MSRNSIEDGDGSPEKDVRYFKSNRDARGPEIPRLRHAHPDVIRRRKKLKQKRGRPRGYNRHEH